MTTIYIRLVDMSIMALPIALINFLPPGAVIIQNRDDNKMGIPGHMDIGAGGPDPFGLKKPIASSNKKS